MDFSAINKSLLGQWCVTEVVGVLSCFLACSSLWVQGHFFYITIMIPSDDLYLDIFLALENAVSDPVPGSHINP